MPGSDTLPVQESVIATNDFQNSPILSEENLKYLDSPSPRSAGEHPQTKDSPLTDIGTSPPPFEIPSLGDRRAHSRDSYESSELSDLGDDDSEAETDKMDFLNEDSNSRLGDRDSDLQRLSDLTDLANLQELDSDDSEDDVSRHVSSPSPESLPPSTDPVNLDEDAGEEVSEEPQSVKRPLETTNDAISETVTENTPEQDEPESTKRRKISHESTPDGLMDTADPELDVALKPELNAVQDIIQSGSEPLSWSAESVVTAVTSVDSSAGAKEEPTISDDAGEQPSISDDTGEKPSIADDAGEQPSIADDAADDAGEQPSTDAELSRSEAEADGGATADVEDVVKQEQNQDDEQDEEIEEHEGDVEVEEHEGDEEVEEHEGDEEVEENEEDEDNEENEEDEENEELEELEEHDEIDENEEDEEHEEIEESEKIEDKPVAQSDQESELPEQEEYVDLDEQRKAAVEELISIEKDFSFLRDKLYRDKLSLLEHEMQLCLEGSHPELLQIYYKVNEFYQDNIKLANATLNYSLKCINTETIATRTSIHQNFMKNLSGMRSDMISETTSSWYKINKEWNYLDSPVADYNFTAIPSQTPNDSCMPFVAGGSSAEYYQDNAVVNKKTQKQNTIVELVRRRNCINAQLGILDGLKEFHGIPSAVSNSLLDDEDAFPVDELLLRKASPDEIKEDLQAMGIY